MTQTVILKKVIAIAYGNAAPFSALFTTVPGANPGTEVAGGVVPYSRQPITWSAPDAVTGAITGTVQHVLPPNTTVAGAGLYSAATGGNYLDGAAITPQTTNSQAQPQSLLNVVYIATPG